MKRLRSLAAAGLATAALVVSSLLVTASAAQAVPTGTVVVHIVDQYGRPTTGVVQLFSAHGGGSYPTSPPPASSTQTFTAPADGYGVAVVTTWSGMTCEGISPCSLSSPPTSAVDVLTVTAAATTTHTTHVTVPSITGGPAIGSPLTIQIPPGLADLQAYAATGGGGSITQQWTRGATEIPGASGTSYNTARDDAAQAVSARLMPSPGMVTLLSSIDVPAPPFSTNAIQVERGARTRTRTKISIARRIRAHERAALTVKVKAKGSATPDGVVHVRVGRFKARKALKKGKVLITLPVLPAGTYTITTTYAGTDEFAKSKGRKTTIVVG